MYACVTSGFSLISAGLRFISALIFIEKRMKFTIYPLADIVNLHSLYPEYSQGAHKSNTRVAFQIETERTIEWEWQEILYRTQKEIQHKNYNKNKYNKNIPNEQAMDL